MLNDKKYESLHSAVLEVVSKNEDICQAELEERYGKYNVELTDRSSIEEGFFKNLFSNLKTVKKLSADLEKVTGPAQADMVKKIRSGDHAALGQAIIATSKKVEDMVARSGLSSNMQDSFLNGYYKSIWNGLYGTLNMSGDEIRDKLQLPRQLYKDIFDAGNDRFVRL